MEKNLNCSYTIIEKIIVRSSLITMAIFLLFLLAGIREHNPHVDSRLDLNKSQIEFLRMRIDYLESQLNGRPRN